MRMIIMLQILRLAAYCPCGVGFVNQQAEHKIFPHAIIIYKEYYSVRKEVFFLFEEKYRQIGARIKYYRNIKELEQAEFAEKTGISRQYLSRLERGASRPSIDLLFRIADVLEVNIAAIMKNDDNI